MSLGSGRATGWLKDRKCSFVRVIDTSDSDMFEVEFQNEKRERKVVKLDPQLLVEVLDQEDFMA